MDEFGWGGSIRSKNLNKNTFKRGENDDPFQENSSFRRFRIQIGLPEGEEKYLKCGET